MKRERKKLKISLWRPVCLRFKDQDLKMETSTEQRIHGKIVAFFFLEEKKMAGRSGTDLIRDNVDTIQQQVRFDASW